MDRILRKVERVDSVLRNMKPQIPDVQQRLVKTAGDKMRTDIKEHTPQDESLLQQINRMETEIQSLHTVISVKNSLLLQYEEKAMSVPYLEAELLEANHKLEKQDSLIRSLRTREDRMQRTPTEMSKMDRILRQYEEQLKLISVLQEQLYNATQNLRLQALETQNMKPQEYRHDEFQGLIQKQEEMRSKIEFLEAGIALRDAHLAEKNRFLQAYSEKLRSVSRLNDYLQGMVLKNEIAAEETTQLNEGNRYVESEIIK